MFGEIEESEKYNFLKLLFKASKRTILTQIPQNIVRE